MHRSWFAGFALLVCIGNGGCGIPSAGTTTPSPQDTQSSSDGSDKKARTLRISYQSPFGNTDTLELNGMFRPVGPWTTGLCAKVTGSDELTCSLSVPAGATSIILSAHAEGDGGANAWSCGESPCGSKTFTEVGVLSVKQAGAALTANLIANGLGCGCNHEFTLK